MIAGIIVIALLWIVFFALVRAAGMADRRLEEIVEECLRAYVDKVYNILLEHGYNLEVTEIVFVGGGANVVKRFGNYDGNNIQYIEDVKANAKGYEYLGRLYVSTHKKEFGLE